MSVSERLYYFATPGWCQLSKYCMLFTLKDVARILTSAPGSSAYQAFREFCIFQGKIHHSSSSSQLMHLEYSIGRNHAASCGLRFGRLPCRSHLIMTNLKVLAMTLYLGKWRGGEVPSVSQIETVAFRLLSGAFCTIQTRKGREWKNPRSSSEKSRLTLPPRHPEICAE